MSELVDPFQSLSTLMLPKRIGEAAFSLAVPDQWQQGRGAYGGLLVGALIRAMESFIEPEKHFRSAFVQMCGPALPGPATIEVKLFRKGSAVTTLNASLIQNGEVQTNATALFGANRADQRSEVVHPTPQIPKWEAIEALQIEPGFAPPFSQHFEFRPVTAAPYSGDATATLTQGFLRPRRPGAPPDAALVAACADVWWPVITVQMSELKPAATIGFTLQFLGVPPTFTFDAPLFHTAKHVAIREGYAIEFRELWTPDGQLVALNQQTIALIR